MATIAAASSTPPSSTNGGDHPSSAQSPITLPQYAHLFIDGQHSPSYDLTPDRVWELADETRASCVVVHSRLTNVYQILNPQAPKRPDHDCNRVAQFLIEQKIITQEELKDIRWMLTLAQGVITVCFRDSTLAKLIIDRHQRSDAVLCTVWNKKGGDHKKDGGVGGKERHNRVGGLDARGGNGAVGGYQHHNTNSNFRSSYLQQPQQQPYGSNRPPHDNNRYHRSRSRSPPSSYRRRSRSRSRSPRRRSPERGGGGGGYGYNNASSSHMSHGDREPLHLETFDRTCGGVLVVPHREIQKLSEMVFHADASLNSQDEREILHRLVWTSSRSAPNAQQLMNNPHAAEQDLRTVVSEFLAPNFLRLNEVAYVARMREADSTPSQRIIIQLHPEIGVESVCARMNSGQHRPLLPYLEYFIFSLKSQYPQPGVLPDVCKNGFLRTSSGRSMCRFVDEGTCRHSHRPGDMNKLVEKAREDFRRITQGRGDGSLYRIDSTRLYASPEEMKRAPPPSVGGNMNGGANSSSWTTMQPSQHPPQNGNGSLPPPPMMRPPPQNGLMAPSQIHSQGYPYSSTSHSQQQPNLSSPPLSAPQNTNYAYPPQSSSLPLPPPHAYAPTQQQHNNNLSYPPPPVQQPLAPTNGYPHPQQQQQQQQPSYAPPQPQLQPTNGYVMPPPVTTYPSQPPPHVLTALPSIPSTTATSAALPPPTPTNRHLYRSCYPTGAVLIGPQLTLESIVYDAPTYSFTAAQQVDLNLLIATGDQLQAEYRDEWTRTGTLTPASRWFDIGHIVKYFESRGILTKDTNIVMMHRQNAEQVLLHFMTPQDRLMVYQRYQQMLQQV